MNNINTYKKKNIKTIIFFMHPTKIPSIYSIYKFNQNIKTIEYKLNLVQAKLTRKCSHDHVAHH